MNQGPDPADTTQCLGAIFDGGVPSNAQVSWIIGDTFLVSFRTSGLRL